MSDPERPYWFPAKRYGWGWGPPATWQGWVTLIVWLVIVIAASPFLARRSLPLFLFFILAMSLVFMAICYAKGEPPRWRWGDRSRP